MAKTWILSPHDGEAEGGLPEPSASGRWIELAGGLEQLSRSLRMHGDNLKDLADVRSVPDVWGSHISFRNALLNPDDKLHANAVGQWRGLLALIALSPGRSADTASPFKVEVRTHNIEEISQKANGEGMAAVAYQYRLQTSLDKEIDPNWLHLLYLHVSGKPDQLVGRLAPDTLVSPSRNAANASIPDTAWFKKGPACPLTDGDLTPIQCLCLAEYCKGLRAAVMDSKVSLGEGVGGQHRNQIAQLFDDFEAGLRERAGDYRRAAPEPFSLKLIPEAGSGLIFQLDNSFKPGEIHGDVTDLWMELRADIGADESFKGCILVDPEAAPSLRESAERISAWRQRSLSELSNPQVYEDVRMNALDSGFLLLRPEDIFSEAFLPFQQPVASAHKTGPLQSGLLPFKPIILMLFEPERLLGGLKVTVEPDRGLWTFELTVRLTSSDSTGGSVEHVLRREYVTNDKRDNARTENPGLAIANSGRGYFADPPEALAAWPDFQSDMWPWNFAYFKGHVTRGAAPVVGVSGPILARDLSRSKEGSGKLKTLAQWSELERDGFSKRWPGPATQEAGEDQDRAWFERLTLKQSAGAERPDQAEIQRCDLAFEAMIFRCEPDEMLVGRDGVRQYYAGIGLFERPRAKTNSNKGAKIAIDFGTSNTTIYVKPDDDHAEEVAFRPRLRYFNADDRENELGADAYRGFFPVETVSQPFSTILSNRSILWTRGKSPDWTNFEDSDPAMWRSHILFGASSANVLEAIWADKVSTGDALDNISTGFKWSSKTGEKDLASRFLTQCALMTLAELMDQAVDPERVDWRISYPEAMDRDSAKSYLDTAKAVVSSISGADAAMESFTESEAAAHYFLEEYGRVSALLVFDVGGGTTDIGVWHDNERIWTGSFMLAGADLILDFVGKNPAFLDRIGADSDRLLGRWLKFMKEEGYLPKMSRSRGPDDKSIAHLINSAEYDATFRKRRARIDGEKEVRRLYAGSRLMLSGLMYYMGLQVRGWLQRNADSETVSEAAFLSPRICLGGRGSTLFHQLHGDKTSRSPLRGCFSLFSAGLMESRDMDNLGEVQTLDDIKPSPKPKHEVALGMLLMEEADIGRLERKRGGSMRLEDEFQVLGEAIDGISKESPDESVRLEPTQGIDDLRRLAAGKPLERYQLHEFDRFLKAVELHTGLTLKIGKRARARLEECLRAEVLAILGVRPLSGEDSLRNVEPPFIRLLRESLRLLYLDPASTADVTEDEVIDFEMR